VKEPGKCSLPCASNSKRETTALDHREARVRLPVPVLSSALIQSEGVAATNASPTDRQSTGFLGGPGGKGSPGVPAYAAFERGVYAHSGHFYDFASDSYLVVSLITPHRKFVATKEAVGWPFFCWGCRHSESGGG
jgi:hypothetical protein